MNEVTGRGINSLVDRSLIFPQRDRVEEKENFADILRGALGEVNQMQLDSSQAVDHLLTGDLENLHQVMIKAEEAQLSLQLTTQVVNKVVQAYQEISRMQI
ncbi:MAG: flagellar hook-basal body complex protein FliE [Bacillota bacterium]